MDKVIIFKNIDGSCGVIIPAAEMFDTTSSIRTSIDMEFINDESILNWIAEKDVPAGLEWRITDKINIPSDRTFRAAWTDDNETETVDVDITKAHEIHKNKLRELRKPILKILDVDYLKADETGDNAAKIEIVDKKQQLRDVTNIGFSNDPKILKTQIPEILYS